MWWKSEKNKISFFNIKINNLNLFVGSKPYTSGITEDFAKKIDSWISLTAEDYPYIYDFDWKTSYHWFPLVESEQWDLKPYFFIKKLLDFYSDLSEEKNIYIHCDLGSHRSPHLTLLWAVHKIGEENTISLLNKANYNIERNDGLYSKGVVRNFIKKFKLNDLFSHHPEEKVLVNTLFDEMDMKSCSDLDGYIDLISEKLNMDRSYFSNFKDERNQDLILFINLKLNSLKNYLKDYFIWKLKKNDDEKKLIIKTKERYKLPLKKYEKSFKKSYIS